MTDFETHVIDSLARLETNMESLVGNGQPGRIKLIENWLVRYGVAIGLLSVLTLGPKAVSIIADFFK